MLRIFAVCLAGPTLLLCTDPALSGDVYAVRASHSGTYTFEPVLRLQRGRIFPPPHLQEDNGCREFLRPPRGDYRVIFGGRSTGTAREGDPVGAGLALAENDAALATNALIPTRESGRRRAADKAERAAAIALFREQMIRRGVHAAALRRLEIVHLTSTDLNHDSRQDFIGTARIDAPPGEAVRTLFAAAVRTDGGYRLVLARYHAGNGETYGMETLVDHADLDGDGADEIITRASGWEWFTYRVYHQRDSRWVRVYEGHGCQGV